LTALARAHGEFTQRRVQVAGVSVDPPPANLQMRNKLLIPFNLLSDASGEVTASYGLWDENEGSSVPSVVMVDSSATVRYVYAGADPADHPPKEGLLAALRTLPRAEKRGMSGPEVVLSAADARERTVRRDLPPVTLEELPAFYEGALSATRTLAARLRAGGWSGRRAAREADRYEQTLSAYRDAIRQTLAIVEGE
jgi:hypothetical protein